MKKNKYIILDNGGKTLDRYTIIERETGEMIGASERPFFPLGFGQYCGNVADNYWFHAYGHTWRNGCNKTILKKRIKYAVDLFLSDCDNVGKIVELDSLPDEVKEYINHAFSTENVITI